MVEAMALGGQRQRARHLLFAEQRRKRLGIIRDVGFGNPLGFGSVVGQLQQFGVGAVDKCLRLGHGRGLLGNFLRESRERNGSE